MSLNQQILSFIFSGWFVGFGLFLPILYLLYRITYFITTKRRERAKKHLLPIVALILLMLACLWIMGFGGSEFGTIIILGYFLTFITLLVIAGRLGI